MSENTQYCNRCGSALLSNSQFCPNCGQRVSEDAPLYPPTQKMDAPLDKSYSAELPGGDFDASLPPPSPTPTPGYAASLPSDSYESRPKIASQGYATSLPPDVGSAGAPPRKRSIVPIIIGGMLAICLCAVVIIGGVFAIIASSAGGVANLIATPTDVATSTSEPTETPLPTETVEPTEFVLPTEFALPTELAGFLTPDPTRPSSLDIPTEEPAVAALTESDDNPFFDDFSTDRDWPFTDTPDEPDYSVKWLEDKYAIHVKSVSIRAWVYPPLSYTPTGVEFDAQIPDTFDGEHGGTFGVMCYYVDKDNFHHVEFDPFNDSFSIVRVSNGTRTALTDEDWVSYDGFNSGAGAVNHISVTCDDALISVAINYDDVISIDDPIVTVLQAAYDEMKVAFSVSTYEDMDPQGFEMWFDNFMAWK